MSWSIVAPNAKSINGNPRRKNGKDGKGSDSKGKKGKGDKGRQNDVKMDNSAQGVTGC
jgi:hypothetical protein